MLSSHRCSRYKDNGRLNNSMRWKENNNVKRVDSVKVSILSNLCKITSHLQGLTLAAIKQSALDASNLTHAFFLVSSFQFKFLLSLHGFPVSKKFKVTHPTQSLKL